MSQPVLQSPVIGKVIMGLGVVLLLVVLAQGAIAPAKPLASQAKPAPVAQQVAQAPAQQPAPQPQAAPAAPAAPVVPQPEPFKVTEVSPAPGESLGGSIKIQFNKPIQMTPATPGGDDVPLKITPPIQGEVLVGGDFIVYRISQLPCEPQTYEVVVNPLVKSADGESLKGNARYLFKNSNRIVEKVWEIDDSTLGVLFLSEIDPATVQSYLEVWQNNLPVSATVEQGSTPKIVLIKIPSGVGNGLQIIVKAGLTDKRGNVLTQTDLVYAHQPMPELRVKNVDWEVYSWEHQAFTVGFNCPVDAKDLAQGLKVTSVETGKVLTCSFRNHGSTTDHAVSFDTEGDMPPGDIVVEIAAGLKGENCRPLKEAYKTTLKGRELRVYIENAQWDTNYWGNEKEGMAVRLNISGKVDLKELRRAFEVTPPVDNLEINPYNQGYKVTGQFESGVQYQFKIKAGLRNAAGGTLATDEVFTTKSEEVPGYLGFAREGQYYFPRRTGLALPMESRNLEKAKVTLTRMFPSNIAMAVDDVNEGRGTERFNYQWGQEVGKAELNLAIKPDHIVETPLNLDSLFPQDKLGVFMLSANAEGKRLEPVYGDHGPTGEMRAEPMTFNTTKIVVWTNMGALAHWQDKELSIFVHDLFSLAPLPNAKVTVYSTKNQVLGTGNTSEQGICQLKAFDKSLGSPRVAVIERENDYTFLELRPRDEDNQALDVQWANYDREGYDAFIYADRELYRPGETIHAHWLVRTNYGDAAAGVPLVVNVVRPNGRNLISQPTVLSDLGTGGIDVTTEKLYQTGKYTVQLMVPGNPAPIGSYEFKLEEFVPNRIKTEVKLNEKQWLSGQQYPVLVNAQHLFGAPASDRRSEVTVIFRRGEFKPENWKGYKFDNDEQFIPEPVSCGEARTDAEGNAGFTFSYTAPAKATFPMKALVVGRVFELGGRPVSSMSESAFFPSPISLGIATAKPADGQGVEVLAAAVNPDGTPAPLDKVTVSLERQTWNYYVRRYYSHHEPNWSEAFETVETQEVPLVGGKGSAVFKPADWGYYRVKVSSPATQQYSTMSFYSHGGEFNEVNGARPSLIKLTTDKDAYKPGEQAVVRVESPFDGQGIIVLQGDDIQQVIPVAITNKVGEVRLDLNPNQCPNVWIEATVIHAVQQDKRQVYPFSSFAMKSVRVLNPERKLQVEFPELATEMRPKTQGQFKVAVKNSAGQPVEAELTLAAVDEGIHGITNYQSPDPYEYLMRARRPDFRRAHYYDKVAYDFEAPQIGGDALLRDLQKRLPSVDENWIKPVALWSGVVRTDATGVATVTMDVPEFTGQLRLVAVSCTPGAVGAGSANIYVRRPYMVRTSMPRFLLPNDFARCRAVVFNTTDAPCKATVSWSSGGTIAAGAGSSVLDVAAHGEATVLAEFTAGGKVGQGEIKWETVVTDASGAEVERLAEVAPVPVRPSGSFQTFDESVLLKPGESREFRNTVAVDDERVEMEITASAMPALRLEKALRHVVGYPYGCVEQTTSKLMPLYLLRKNNGLLPSAIDPKEIDSYINSGITRLFSMQTPDGGLGYWPGYAKSYPYGSVYALHCLTMIKNGREHELPEQNFKALQEYVRSVTNNATFSDDSGLFLRAYGTFVLALDGDLKAIQQIQRFDTLDLPRHASYILAAALAKNTQDTDRIKMYLAKSKERPYTIREQDNTLNSEPRNTAIELLALVRTGLDPAEAAEKAKELAGFLETHYYGTTQENAFIITALIEYLGTISEGVETAAAKITGPSGEAVIAGDQVGKLTHTGPGGVFTVANTGGKDVCVNLTIRGVSLNLENKAVSEGGIAVERKVFTAQGAPYDEISYVQGQSYIVSLAVDCTKDLKNVVLLDMLPAGFEIENPRLNANAIPNNSLPAPTAASYLDVRDDRVVSFFDSLETGKHYFYYIVRAVTPGKYDCPGASSECMYDASVHARTAGIPGVEVASAR